MRYGLIPQSPAEKDALKHHMFKCFSSPSCLLCSLVRLWRSCGWASLNHSATEIRGRRSSPTSLVYVKMVFGAS